MAVSRFLVSYLDVDVCETNKKTARQNMWIRPAKSDVLASGPCPPLTWSVVFRAASLERRVGLVLTEAFVVEEDL